MQKAMERSITEISINGNTVKVNCSLIDGRTVVVRGDWLKRTFVQDELFIEGDVVRDPGLFVSILKERKLGDIFTFAEKPIKNDISYPYHYEWDNAAIIPVSSYAKWLEEDVESDVRKAVKRSKKRGVSVRSS